MPLILIFLLLLPSFALGQIIPKKEFTKTNSPVFVTNGFVDFYASSTNQASSFESKTLPDNISDNYYHGNITAGNDSQLFFKTGIKNEQGAIYGAVAKVEFNVNSRNRNTYPNIDQAYVFAENPWQQNLKGTFEFGNNFAVNQKMKTGPAQFARGAGGINGKYLEYVNLPMLADSSNSVSAACNSNPLNPSCDNIKLPRFILLPQSPIGHGGYAKSFYSFGAGNSYSSNSTGYGDYNRNSSRYIKDNSFDGFEDATKISYYSPKIENVQLGLSFTPNSSNQGVTATTATGLDQIRVENILSFGLSYSNYFDNVGLSLSATGEKGKTKSSQSKFDVERNDLFAYDFGASIEYFGFTIGASYGSWGKSLQPKNGIYSCDYDPSTTLTSQTCLGSEKKFKNPSYYSLGIAYQFGPFATSITSLRSEFEQNKFQADSFGIDYKLRKNLIPYFEVTRFRFESNQVQAANISNQAGVADGQRQVRDNRGVVVMTGMLLSF